MNVEAYLLEQQKPIHDLFAKARKTGRWSHAYLLHGYNGQPLKDIANFLAQTLLCEKPTPLACGRCLTCERFLKQDYTDIILIDGSEQSIKKQDVINLESRFAITGLEKANKQVYVLHQVEGMTPEAINALLKFLEEPTSEIYAFLTTTSLDDVLPTIQSRSQIIHFKPNNQRLLIEQGVAKRLTIADAELLSFECANVESMLEKSKEEGYLGFTKHFQTLHLHWQKDPYEALYYFRQSWLPLLQEVNAVSEFMQRWMVVLMETGKAKTKQAVILKSYVSMLLVIGEKLKDPYQSFKAFQSRHARLDKSTNLNLFLEAMMIELIGA
jgi:DNA polymerase-3 subunit delta'